MIRNHIKEWVGNLGKIELTEEMVADGELTEEEVYMRNDFRKDEILMEMEVNIGVI